MRIVIKPQDIEWEAFRGSGKGGQHRNKTDSCVRYRHIPTGITAESHEERKQGQNRKVALVRLLDKLYDHYSQAGIDDADKRYHDKPRASFSSQLRTYWLCGDQRVVDHVTGVVVKNPRSVLDGDIDVFIEANMRANQ